ncbi:BAG family molecular chaperone regulator 4 isoform X2 [Alosa pseudoharengus]|uniref:BAG family molecular chaperone regulator 4 isoform X2 n=1 Tax=Alosa alosa TaxID=278164 RepID=UPI0020152522|nr:BAG family molecular chaperone regulator 4 isoform X2 [Alosa alosa]
MAYDTAGNDRSGGEPAWVMHQMQASSKPHLPSHFNSENNNWNGTMDSTPYSGYPSNYWYPQSHTTGPYGNAYPPGTEVNGQPPYQLSAYPNGVYNPQQYSTNMLHPSNPFYCAEQMPPRQPHYHNQGCPERSAAQPAPPPYPVQHCQGGPGYHPGSYQHYGEGGPTMPQNPPYPGQQAMHSRAPQPEAWAHSGGYSPSPAPQQQWQPGNQAPHGPYGNHVRPPHPPPWQGPAPPPYEHKDHQFSGQHPQARPQPLGPKPRPITPNQAQGKPTEFSAPPQLYKPGGGKLQESKPAQAEPPPQAPNPTRAPPGPQLSDNPSLARVQQVMFRVQLLQEDVDEFVGKKTDKSYRCLEELLTKELLVLDSVETNGQEVVRLARKDTVQRIQGILDQLEKKAF